MRTAVFSTKGYDQQFLDAANETTEREHEFLYFENRLRSQSAALVRDVEAVCVFVHDQLDRECLEKLHEHGVRYVVLRCAGYNQVDLRAATELGIRVARVPAYSPHAVAEHGMALVMTLNRQTHRAYNRVREGNFSLEGMIGFDLRGKTVGVVGTGKIGQAFVEIALGFGCRVLAQDIREQEDLKAKGVTYVELDQLFAESDIISLHVPLFAETRHLINEQSIAQMKDGVYIVNTSRGGLVDTRAVIGGIKSGRIGGLALDVYEEEADFFYEDLSGQIIQDDVLMRLTTFPNVIMTSHQGFFTAEALRSIAETTVRNLSDFAAGREHPNEVKLD